MYKHTYTQKERSVRKIVSQSDVITRLFTHVKYFPGLV